MQRLSIVFLAATLACVAGAAQAQGGDLAGVTMRVLDDVSDIDAVILELDANRGDDEDGVERDGRPTRRPDPAADGDSAAGADNDRLDDGREGDELHDPGVDERSEGRLEDRDVERPAAAQPTP